MSRLLATCIGNGRRIGQMEGKIEPLVVVEDFGLDGQRCAAKLEVRIVDQNGLAVEIVMRIDHTTADRLCFPTDIELTVSKCER